MILDHCIYMVLNYIFIFFTTLSVSAVFTVAVKYIADKLKIIDRPGGERKIHRVSTPLLGGVAIFLSFFLVLYFVRDKLMAGDLEAHHWVGFFIGAGWLVLGGYLDDRYNLKPSQQIVFPLLAIISVIAGGVEVAKITNPFGGLLFLDKWQIPIFPLGDSWHYFVVVSDIFIMLWLMGMMFTTKLLDGIDGLVTGVTAIGAFIIFLFTITTKYYQPDIGLAALVLAAVCLGFLIFNWHPAKIFLGEGGSLLLGFILGVLAIISGGKIAIALLVMGIPIMDVAWTIVRRVAAGRNPFNFADRKHLHFRLLDLGLGQRKTAFIYYCFATLFGLSALFLQSMGKALVLGILVVIMLGVVIGFTYLDKKVKNIN